MSDQELSPVEVAQNEAARQAVILLFGIISVLLVVAVQRAAANPDFYRDLRMKLSKGSERFLARLAASAWRGAERARLRYERESA